MDLAAPVVVEAVEVMTEVVEAVEAVEAPAVRQKALHLLRYQYLRQVQRFHMQSLMLLVRTERRSW